MDYPPGYERDEIDNLRIMGFDIAKSDADGEWFAYWDYAIGNPPASWVSSCESIDDVIFHFLFLED